MDKVSTADSTSSSLAGPAEGLFLDRRALSLAERAKARWVHVNVVASIIIARRLGLLLDGGDGSGAAPTMVVGDDDDC